MLEDTEKDYVLLIRCGAFFVSVGKNAVYLSELFNLKITCITGNMCKIGIPVDSIYNYIDKMEKIGFSFVIYNYSKNMVLENNQNYAVAYRYRGFNVDKEEIEINCSCCEKYEKNKKFGNINLFEDLKQLQKEKENRNNERK